MEYDEEDNGAFGSIPEFGAIFMSNIETKKECFKRKIFALPSSMAEFVKHIKAGMVLFLFEFNKRQLFGVYQASSDGAINIVPHAFSYSGKHLSAQVCFTPIWHCDPLSEKEFRYAIRENYFSAKKFKFGLSEDQVRRLLYLFSSKKLKNEMHPHPLSEAIVGVTGKDRRLVGYDRPGLSERGYMEPDEYDEFNPATFGEHHVNSFARAREDEVFTDDGVDTEGETYPFSQEDFLAKRRRIVDDDRLLTNDIAENRIYNLGTLRTFHIDSPKDSLDEVRRLDEARRLLTVERLNENQVDEIHNPIQSSEYLVGPLGVRANDDFRFMQRSRLFDEYNMHNDSGQAFPSDRYGKSLEKSKPAIDDDRFLLNDCVQKGYNIYDRVKPMAYGDGNLNLCWQARNVIDDHERLMNGKLENRYHLDCDGKPISALEHSAILLDKRRKATAAGRFPINDNEPDLGSLEGFSSENFSSPLQSGDRIAYDRKYQIKEGRLTENMVDLCSASLAKNAGYTANVDRRVVDDGKFRKSERVGIEEDSQTRTNPIMSMEYPSFSQPKQKMSSFSDNLSPEKGLSKFTMSQNFYPSHSSFHDATITKAVPYLPDHPNLSYGCSGSGPVNQKSRLVRENHPYGGSLGNSYSISKNKSPQYFLELEKSSRPLDIAPEFGNKCFPISTPGHESSFLQEAGSSFVSSNLSMHMDLNTSAPVNYRGSLFSKICPPFTDIENIEGEKGEFAYPSESGENHFAFDENLLMASQHVSEHVARREMNMFDGKDLSYPEAKDFGLGIRHPERDLASHENQYFRFPSKMDLKELHKISEAPHANLKVNRRSVFTRLTSGEESQFGEEKNGIDFNQHDCCMDATADDVMGMLKQGNNLSLRKLRKSRVGGQPTHGENAIFEKKIQCHIETNHSTMVKETLNDASVGTTDGMIEVPKETRIVDLRHRSDRKKILVGINADSDGHDKEKLNDASVATADGMHEVPKETRIVDFKRRSDRKKNLVRINADSDGHDEERLNDATLATADSMDEVPKETRIVDFKRRSDRKKILVRINDDSDGRNEEKLNDASVATADSMDEVPKETRIVDFKRRHDRKKNLVGVSAHSDAHDKNNGANEEVKSSMKSALNRKKLVRPVFSKTEPATDAIRSSETPQIPTPIHGKDDKRSCETAIISVGEANMSNDDTRLSKGLASCSDTPTGYSARADRNPEEQKNVAAHVLPSTSHEFKEHSTTNVDCQIGSSEVLKETTQQKSFGIQTSVESILTKDFDTTIPGLNLQESSLEGFKLGAGSGSSLTEEKHTETLESIKETIKTNETDTEPSN